MRIYLPVNPVAKQRPRLGNWGVYTPKKTRDSESEIKLYLKARYREKPLEGAVRLEITFILKRPKSKSNRIYPSVRPDLDNFAKLVLDASNGVLYEDDGQICQLTLEKVYGEIPAIVLNIESI